MLVVYEHLDWRRFECLLEQFLAVIRQMLLMTKIQPA